jgi:uncharacterized protein YceK
MTRSLRLSNRALVAVFVALFIVLSGAATARTARTPSHEAAAPARRRRQARLARGQTNRAGQELPRLDLDVGLLELDDPGGLELHAREEQAPRPL